MLRQKMPPLRTLRYPPSMLSMLTSLSRQAAGRFNCEKVSIYAISSRNIRCFTWLKLLTPLGKLQALASATRDQRREYKAKFVDLDVEFQRMKDRLEMLNVILDDMHVSENLL